MFLRNLVSLLPVVAGIANAVPLDQLEQRGGGGYGPDDTCTIWGGGGHYENDHIPTTIIKVITEEYTHFPVFVDEYCESNTVLNFYGDVVISIFNAPTHVRTIATGWRTQTNTAYTTCLPYSDGSELNIYETEEVNYFPVNINTYIENNGIIQFGGQINIVVNNAPTSISTIANGTTTVTSTVTVTTTQGNARPTAFILAISPAGPGRKGRRQAAQKYLGVGGAVVTSCSDAAILTISNGQLSNNGDLFSTNNGTAFAKFSAASAIGAISTTFTNAVELLWQNAAFNGGAARFCELNAFIYSIFSGNNVPGCSTVDLLAIRSDLCNGGVIIPSGSSTRSSTTTTGATSSTSGTGSGNTSGSTSGTVSSIASSTSSTSGATSSTTSSTTSFSSTTSSSTTSSTSTSSTAPPVCLLANNQQLNAAGTACQCIPLYANSSGTSTLVCTLIPDCTVGPNQVLNTATNQCQCKVGYADSDPNVAVLACTFTPSCDPAAKQVLNTQTNSCVCIPGFADDPLVPGFLCAISCPAAQNQVANGAGTACVCATGFADSNTLDTVLTCTFTPTCSALLGQVLDPVTNSCKCNQATGFSNINPTGVLTCATCLIGQTLNAATNVCSCPAGKTPLNLPVFNVPLVCPP